jgi:hypothetical protein
VHKEVIADIVERFGVSFEEAERLVREADAKHAVKGAVAEASRGRVAAQRDDDLSDPGVWRRELKRRLAALDVLEEGVESLRELQKYIEKIVKKEEKLIQSKRAKANNRHIDWWDFRDSGWAMGGRERFASCVGDILRNLDEGQLGKRVVDKIGFIRSIPLPELADDEVELEGVPANDIELEAELVKPRAPANVIKSV